ncbi:DNA polymerase III subunit beta [Bifidobacterium minimum]|uniref:DNA polymerase III subunit beta n=1 Tax=Bifidobacterium minimum TaxID=1693 RepID=A0A087BNQ1_9BIFI|nr:HAD family hydrolase [Bifidobacterium minimum]KFI72651.1 DNA polymerase III subunit beta [Bifidobacterium minimum]
MVVADLDGTLLHDAPTFEERFITRDSVEAVRRLKDHGVLFAVSTARPVSTGYSLVELLRPDACVYLNGALIDLSPRDSTSELLISGATPADGHVISVGFPSTRGCEVCRMLLDEIPDLRIGLVMNDVRYTNFDMSVYWKTQIFRYTDFTDVPEGSADKIIIFPEQRHITRLRSLIPPDFSVGISEGTMWMLMNPRANKADSFRTLCRHFSVEQNDTAAFGDDLIDIAMLRAAGCGVAVANAAPSVLTAADDVCPSNNDDGVAWWITPRFD